MFQGRWVRSLRGFDSSRNCLHVRLAVYARGPGSEFSPCPRKVSPALLTLVLGVPNNGFTTAACR